jgi:two-component system NtrC family sensor kinase
MIPDTLEQKGIHAPDMTPARVLVVDDDADIARTVHDALTLRLGYQVTVASDGASAREALLASLEPGKTHYDLVLLDMGLPDVRGREVLAWIRSHQALKYTRVIILTAITSDAERIAALSAGADDYVTKPTSTEELLARVKTTIRSHAMEKQLQRQSQQLARLNQVTTQLVSLRDRNVVLAGAVEGARQLLDVDLAAIFVYYEKHNGLYCPKVSADVDPAPSYTPIPVGYGLISRAFQEQTPLFLNDPKQAPGFSATFDEPRNYPVRNMLIGPLRAKQHRAGVLVALNKRHGGFTETDFDLFVALSNAVSRAVENAWLFGLIMQKQQTIGRNRDRLQAVVDGIPHPIYAVTQQWQVQTVNKARRDTLENDVDPIGKPCYEVFFGRHQPCEECAVQATLAQAASSRWAVRRMRPNQMAQEWDVTAYPVPSPSSGAPQAVVVWEDITEERRLEYSLMQAGKLAAVGQLAAGVAHEINNPLAVITASAQMLKMQTAENDERFELIDLIDQASERAHHVVQGLLDLSRQREYQFAPVDVNDTLRLAHSLIAYQLQSADIALSMDLAQDLPLVTASADHLQSVWINLMINARDALVTRPKERKLDIVTRLRPDDDQVQVLIRDNGEGMTESERERIFEPFYTTKAPGQGTGLGLSTSHRIIEQHGGEIDVLSEPSEGTTFVIRLPLSA